MGGTFPEPSMRGELTFSSKEQYVNRKKVIIVSGLPGSGKSTLAEGLAECLRFPIFSVDPIESSMIRSGIARGFETSLAAYLVAEILAQEQLRLGLSIIIDAVCPVKEAREMWRKLANRHAARLIIIECILNRDLHRKRLESRTRTLYGIAAITWQEVERRRNEYQRWEEERLVLDTSAATELNVRLSLEYIRGSG
jgi:predicted kinase